MTVTLRIMVAHVEEHVHQHPDTSPRPHDSTFNGYAPSAICTKLSLPKSHRLAPNYARQQRNGAAERAHSTKRSARPGQPQHNDAGGLPEPHGPQSAR